jgi:hypothetical protein
LLIPTLKTHTYNSTLAALKRPPICKPLAGMRTTMYNTQRRHIFYHCGLSVILAVLIWTLTILTAKLFPDIGYGISTAVYLFILTGLIYYYVLTTYFSIGLSVVTFILNFILWVAEQVNIEKAFHDSFIYQANDKGFITLILGGLLWTVNKLLLDKVFGLFRFHTKPLNRLDNIISGTRLKRTTR